MPVPAKKAINPFYILLILVGTLFVITTVAYGMMMLRGAQSTSDGEQISEPSELVDFISEHGETVLFSELAILAICTCGAIATDSYWQNRQSALLAAADNSPDVHSHQEDS